MPIVIESWKLNKKTTIRCLPDTTTLSSYRKHDLCVYLMRCTQDEDGLVDEDFYIFCHKGFNYLVSDEYGLKKIEEYINRIDL